MVILFFDLLEIRFQHLELHRIEKIDPGEAGSIGSVFLPHNRFILATPKCFFTTTTRRFSRFALQKHDACVVWCGAKRRVVVS
ncbi:MAG TPA: hypothetical protein PLE32_07550, partial [Haliscomenobacter sp.]|nr:hypothetical protein [Haliscomenobacter sp.]